MWLQIHTGHGETGTLHAMEGGGMAVDLSNVTEATLNQDGQLILTGEDGQSKHKEFFLNSQVILCSFLKR